MKRIPFRLPYILLFPGGLSFLIASFFTTEDTIDIHVDDTYFVIAGVKYYMLPGLFLLVLWLLYALLHKIMASTILSWIQIFLTLLSFACFLLVPLWRLSSERKSSYESWTSFESFGAMNMLLSLSLLAFLSALALFFLNLLAGIIRKLIQRNK